MDFVLRELEELTKVMRVTEELHLPRLLVLKGPGCCRPRGLRLTFTGYLKTRRKRKRDVLPRLRLYFTNQDHIASLCCVDLTMSLKAPQL